MKWIRQTSLIALLMLTACGLPGGSQPDDAAVQASVEAVLRATAAAQAELSPSPPSADASPTAPPASPTAATATTAPVAEIVPTATPSSAPATATELPSAAQPTEGGSDELATSFEPSTDAAQQTVNIELVFDASGSMAQTIPGSGETRIQAARRAMERVIDTLPEQANLNVGFRVYGHRGDNTDAGRAESCQSTELLVAVQGVDKELLRTQTNAFEPTGWTPISLALQRAGEDLVAGENVKNVIIMVTDGEETCEGDPCAVAEALYRSDAEVRIDVVGFGQDPSLGDKLRCVAANSGGIYIDAEDGDALVQTLEELIQSAIRRAYLRVVAINADGQPASGLRLTDLVDVQGAPAAGEFEEQFAGFNRLDDGELLIGLLPGSYSFTISAGTALTGGQNANAAQTYSAVVEEGRETVAVVGLGAIVLQPAGGEEGSLRGLQLQVELDGEWVTLIGGSPILAGLRFDEPYELMPGRHRLYDSRNDRMIGDEIVVVPGKRVVVELSGS
jgi:Mg-chelatase subunit ChlD